MCDVYSKLKIKQIITRERFKLYLSIVRNFNSNNIIVVLHYNTLNRLTRYRLMGVQLLKFNLLWMNKYYPVKLDRLIVFIYEYILIIIWIFF